MNVRVLDSRNDTVDAVGWLLCRPNTLRRLSASGTDVGSRRGGRHSQCGGRHSECDGPNLCRVCSATAYYGERLAK